MIKKITPIVFFLTLSYCAMAQSTEPAKGPRRPDIPGSFALELGLNRLTDPPNQLSYGLWGSRSLNVYYLYDMRIGQSKFTFHPGIGFGMERYKLLSFKNYFPNDTVKYQTPTLMYDNLGNTVFVPAANYIYDGDTLGQIDLSSRYRTKKSMLTLNYIDVPLELRFNTKPDDPARSFKVGIGGRVGYLLNAHTKIKYTEDGDPKRLKTTQSYNLNRFRYSVSLKFYLGNFSIFGYYNLNPLFKEDKGPMKTQTASYTIGISLSSF